MSLNGPLDYGVKFSGYIDRCIQRVGLGIIADPRCFISLSIGLPRKESVFLQICIIGKSDKIRLQLCAA